MTEMTPHSDFKQRYPLSFGIAVVLHLLVFTFVAAPDVINSDFFKQTPRRNAIQIVKFGDPNSKLYSNYFNDYKSPVITSRGDKKNQRKGRPLSFNDLKLDPEKVQPKVATTPVKTFRPGSLPQVDTAMKGIKFENNELKKMARESLGGAHNMLAGDRISLKYEVPNGKSLDELNDSELRLYGFLKRGAKNYTTSIMAELHDFELKYPHLHFPLTETKQVMTGRLTYDEKGNLKQIKMIRWTNVDKLQGFFENVLKRMEVMQNPPKELWVENNEFTVFITLQING